MAVIKKNGGYMALPINIKRGNPIPLDSTSIWYDYAEMETYARSSSVAYVGQIVVYVNEESRTTSAYIIKNEAGDLIPVGSGSTANIDVDNQTIVLDGEGKLALKNFGVEYYKYIAAVTGDDGNIITPATYELQIVDDLHPWKTGLVPQVILDPKDGTTFTLGWYEPNPTTIEGINSSLAGLQTEVGSLRDNLTNNYFTKEQARAEFAGALHYKGQVETIDDLELVTDAIAGDVYIVKDSGKEYIYDGTNWEELGSQSDISAMQTEVGTLKTQVANLQTNVSTLDTKVTNLKATVDNHNSTLETLNTKVSDLETVIGTPAKEGSAATGIFKVIEDNIADLNAITGVSINGTNAPISNSIVQLYDFTQSNGLAGLVPVPTAEQIADTKDYFLTAKGEWVIPNDPRIGNLTYNETTYNTVEDYIEGRMADVSLTWESIT